MARYIDANEVIVRQKRALDASKLPEFKTPITWERAINRFIKEIENAPTAAVEEVRHGEWEGVDVDFAVDRESHPDLATMRCSKCGRYHTTVYFYGDPTEMEHYCSFCGAKMDGRKE